MNMKTALIIMLAVLPALSEAGTSGSTERHRAAPVQSALSDSQKLRLLDSVWNRCPVSQDPQKLPNPSKKWFVCKSCGNPRNSPVACRTVSRF